MNNHHKYNCEDAIAEELVKMVQEEMGHLLLEDQNQRLTAFCESVSASRHIPATVSE